MDLDVEFKPIICCSCSVTFAVPAPLERKWRNTHQWFYCPSCRTEQHFSGETEAEKLKKKVEQYKGAYEEKLNCCVDLREEVEHQQRRVNGYKGKLVQVQNQIGN